MKKAVVLSLIVAFLSSCYQTKIAAPPGKTVVLATQYENLPLVHKEKNWYILFGLIPLNKGTTERVILKNNLTKVRVKTKFGFGDYMLTILLNVIIPTTIATNTVIVEGEHGGQKIEQKSRWE